MLQEVLNPRSRLLHSETIDPPALSVLWLYFSLGNSTYIYREDIYSFAVDTINIVIECNENISIFHECEARVKIWMFSLHEMKKKKKKKKIWKSLKKSKFSFYFIVYTPMRVSDVITNVTKQNMNVMASTFSD